MAKGRTFPKKIIGFGVSFFDENNKNGTLRVMYVTTAIMAMVIMDCMIVCVIFYPPAVF